MPLLLASGLHAVLAGMTDQDLSRAAHLRIILFKVAAPA